MNNIIKKVIFRPYSLLAWAVLVAVSFTAVPLYAVETLFGVPIDRYFTVTFDDLIGAYDEFVKATGIEVEYKEDATHSESRTITIDFESGDSKIEIIGTYVIPEFGTIAFMILIVGITSMIILTRNRFQIVPRL